MLSRKSYARIEDIRESSRPESVKYCNKVDLFRYSWAVALKLSVLLNVRRKENLTRGQATHALLWYLMVYCPACVALEHEIHFAQLVKAMQISIFWSQHSRLWSAREC